MEELGYNHVPLEIVRAFEEHLIATEEKITNLKGVPLKKRKKSPGDKFYETNIGF